MSSVNWSEKKNEEIGKIHVEWQIRTENVFLTQTIPGN